MNAIDQFLFNNLEVFATITIFVPLAIVAWLTRNNYDERVYTLPDHNAKRVS